MNRFSRLIGSAVNACALVVAMGISACGGGPAGTPILGSDPGKPDPVAPIASSLDVSSSLAKVPNTTSDGVVITVIAKGSGGVTVGNAPVSFSVDANASITPSGTKTDASSGQLTAKVLLGSDRTNRVVTVTATSGSVSQKVSFQVVDSETGSNVAALSSTPIGKTIPNDGSNSLTVVFTALDNNNSALIGVPISFAIVDAAANPAFSQVSSGTTSAKGQITVTVSVPPGHPNGAITLKATSGTVTSALSFEIIDAAVTTAANSLSLLASQQSIKNTGGESSIVTVTALDANRNTVSGVHIGWSTSSGILTPDSVVTDKNGSATAKVQIGSDRSNRVILVTAKSGSLPAVVVPIEVTGAALQANLIPPSLKAGDSGVISYI